MSAIQPTPRLRANNGDNRFLDEEPPPHAQTDDSYDEIEVERRPEQQLETLLKSKTKLKTPPKSNTVTTISPQAIAQRASTFEKRYEWNRLSKEEQTAMEAKMKNQYRKWLVPYEQRRDSFRDRNKLSIRKINSYEIGY